jgi:hypothetical protein
MHLLRSARCSLSLLRKELLAPCHWHSKYHTKSHPRHHIYNSSDPDDVAHCMFPGSSNFDDSNAEILSIGPESGTACAVYKTTDCTSTITLKSTGKNYIMNPGGGVGMDDKGAFVRCGTVKCWECSNEPCTLPREGILL